MWYLEFHNIIVKDNYTSLYHTRWTYKVDIHCAVHVFTKETIFFLQKIITRKQKILATKISVELKLKLSFWCKKSMRKKKNILFEILNLKINSNFCLLLNKKLITMNKQLFITAFGSPNYYKHSKVEIVKIGQFLTKL